MNATKINKSLELINTFQLRKAEHTVCICLRIQEYKGKVFPLQARLWPRGWVEV